MYEEYDSCRNQQLIHTRKPAKGAKGAKGAEEIVVVQWPSGYSQLPREGGMQDQPFYTMRIYSGFMKGEKLAAGALMSSKGSSDT